MPCNYLRLNKASKKKEYFSLIFGKRRFSKLSEKYFEIKENSYITNVTFFSSLGSVNQTGNLRKKLFVFTIQAEPDLETNTSQDSFDLHVKWTTREKRTLVYSKTQTFDSSPRQHKDALQYLKQVMHAREETGPQSFQSFSMQNRQHSRCWFRNPPSWQIFAVITKKRDLIKGRMLSKRTFALH